MTANGTMRRMHFFDGFLTTAQDWNDGQAYLLEKRRLHNRVLHGPGVLPQGGGLRVSARARGDLSVEIGTGLAIDPAGNELVLEEPVVKRVEPERYTLPATLFVVLRHEEAPVDWIEYPEHPAFKGHRRIEERCRVEVSDAPGDGVELARFRLTDDIRELRDAANPENPRDGEIDLRFVSRAGVAGHRFTPEHTSAWRVAFRDLRAHASALVTHGLPAARELRTLVDTLCMLQVAGSVGEDTVRELLAPVLEREQEVAEEVERTKPQLAARRGFADYRRAVEACVRLASTPGEVAADTAALLRLRTGANAALAAVLRERIEAAPEPAAEVPSWKEVAGWSREFPETLNVEGLRLRRVDVLEVVDDASVRAHRFVIEGHKDTWRSRQSFSYPDRVEVSDAGVAFVGGQARFRVNGLAPGRDLILIKRYDALFGEQSCDVFANGERVGAWKVSDSDRRHRWRNHHFLVPGAFISGDSVEIVKKAVSAERDVNVFRFWFYQPG